MGVIEEFDAEEIGLCEVCKDVAQNKCNNCKETFYCSRDCQKKHWKLHKVDCKKLPYKMQTNNVLGRYLIATRNIKKDEVIFKDTPLVLGPAPMSQPVCLHCYKSVNGSFK